MVEHPSGVYSKQILDSDTHDAYSWAAFIGLIIFILIFHVAVIVKCAMGEKTWFCFLVVSLLLLVISGFDVAIIVGSGEYQCALHGVYKGYNVH